MNIQISYDVLKMQNRFTDNLTCTPVYDSHKYLVQMRLACLSLTEYSIDDVTVLLYLVQPPFDVAERVAVGDVIHHYDAMGPSVVPGDIEAARQPANRYSHDEQTLHVME